MITTAISKEAPVIPSKKHKRLSTRGLKSCSNKRRKGSKTKEKRQKKRERKRGKQKKHGERTFWTWKIDQLVPATENTLGPLSSSHSFTSCIFLSTRGKWSKIAVVLCFISKPFLCLSQGFSNYLDSTTGSDTVTGALATVLTQRRVKERCSWHWTAFSVVQV